MHQADVDVAGLQSLGLLGVAHFTQDDAHAGRLLAHLPQRAGQGVKERRGHESHRQLARAAPPDLPGAPGRRINAGDAGAHVLQDGLRGGRGRRALPRPLEQAHAQVFLHARQRLAQRRLRNAQPVRGAAHAAVVNHCQEVPQMPGFHIVPIYLMRLSRMENYTPTS